MQTKPKSGVADRGVMSRFQKPGGSRIKTIGEKARADIARLFDRKVHLFLEVKIDEKWQDRPAFYQTFGLEFGKK